MTSSLENVESYSYSDGLEASTSFLSDAGNMALEASNSEQNDGYLDLADLAYRISSKSTRIDCQGGSTECLAEAFLLDGFLYACEDNLWTKSAISDESRAIEEKDELQRLTKMISGSRVDILGSEQIDGERCYKLRVAPSPDVGRRIIASQALEAVSGSPIALPDINADSLANDDGLSSSETVWTAWVSAEDYLLRQVSLNTAFTLMPESLHPPQNVQDLQAESTSNKTTTFSGFNGKRLIILPDEARSAEIIQG